MTLRQSANPVDQQIATYLEAIDALHFISPPPPIEALGIAIHNIQKGKTRRAESGHPVHVPRIEAAAEEPYTARTLAIKFLEGMFYELREIICGKGKTPTGLGTKTQAVLTAIAAAIGKRLGVDNPTALGLAVLLLLFLSLGNAAKKHFAKFPRPRNLRN
jgi:hypothetical protein